MQTEPVYKEKSCVRTIEKTFYWIQHGSSKTRKSEQQLIPKMVNQVPEHTIISFTDGSCVSSPIHVELER